MAPRCLGLLVEDSDDPAAARLFVDHVIRQNEPLPILDRAAKKLLEKETLEQSDIDALIQEMPKDGLRAI